MSQSTRGNQIGNAILPPDFRSNAFIQNSANNTQRQSIPPPSPPVKQLNYWTILVFFMENAINFENNKRLNSNMLLN